MSKYKKEPTNREMVISIDEAIHAFVEGGFVNEYSLANGARVRKSNLNELMALRNYYAKLAYEEDSDNSFPANFIGVKIKGC